MTTEINLIAQTKQSTEEKQNKSIYLRLSLRLNDVKRTAHHKIKCYPNIKLIYQYQ